ncbi:hypothetical protein L596_013117 [Steinernema carpocapsae]|uniref:SHSP domain-containing protein n=1 Tax=Steinernema carpocapsae TaxID=34508 RepID=A0A4U5NZQ1_STECR|nr:hypothetical protein L596_013117 [Steinernema carpocapsae]
MASTDWEHPISESGSFAIIKDNDNIYQVKIDLTAFEPTFAPKDINVSIYNNDIQISASRENPIDPNFPRTLHRQYRMPDNVDLKSIRLSRQLNFIKVDAKKIELGKPVMINMWMLLPTVRRILSSEKMIKIISKT